MRLEGVYLKTMEENKIDIKEFLDFVERIKDERYRLYQRIGFLSQHNFKREAEYLSDKMATINEITHELELVAKGEQKGIETKLNFLA
jgi:hypothetical protein